jgi:dephospho-CoA kinase
MKNINIIFITGKAGSGKDTVAQHLCSKYNYVIFRYADALKSLLTSAGWDGNKDLKGRKLLQSVGKAFRDYNIDFWVNKVIKQINNIIYTRLNIDEDINICISDARHLNEINTVVYKLKETNKNIINNYNINIKIIRLINNNRAIDREMDEETKNDISEIGLNDFNFNDYNTYTINNIGTMDDLYRTIDKIF